VTSSLNDLSIFMAPGSSRTVEPKMLVNPFGDGYVQRAADGINTDSDVYSVSTSNLTETEADALETFFRDHKDGTHFVWTPPGSAVVQKFMIKDWTRTWVDANNYVISADFIEVFDL